MKLLAALVAVLCLLPTAAQAGVERYAVIVGNDRGVAGDEPLRYAESDATRVFEVLRDLGGFQPVNMVLLRNEDAETVRRTLIAVNDRIRSAVSLPDGQAMLFVYYSGHADADELHLGATRLAVTELAQLARGSSANFRVVVLDACRSGTLTRSKGGKILAPFELSGEYMPEDGLAFLSASAANEDAQESDELRASFFTHALVSGLLGAADRDGDGTVGLEEAYRYAYDATIRATSRTFSGTQHPTFRYDFRGQGAVVLTRLEAHEQLRATLEFPAGLGFLVMRDGAQGPVVAEVEERAQQRSLSLRPGRYFVRARGPAILYEGPLMAAAGSRATVDVAQLTRIEYAHLVRKGGQRELTWANALEVGVRMRSVSRNTDIPCVGAFVGYGFDVEHIGARARLGACRSGFDNAYVRATTDIYDLDVRLYHAWDWSILTLELGLGGGLSLLRVEIETRRQAPRRDTLSPFVALGGGALLDLGSAGLFLHLDVAAETYFLRLRKDAVSPIENNAQFALRGALGLGSHF